MTLVEMEGNVHGRWTVLSRAGSDSYGQSTWLCRCECGTERAVRGHELRRGMSQSCGCLKAERISARKVINLDGQRFGRLTVLREHGRNERQSVTWLCSCICGNEKVANGAALRARQVKSCGCLQPDSVIDKWAGYQGHTVLRSRRKASLRPGRAPVRTEVWERDGGLCHICDALVQMGEPWEMDHVIPIVHGGTDEMRNVAVSHEKCNHQKNDAISWNSPLFAEAHQAFMEFHGRSLRLESA